MNKSNILKVTFLFILFIILGSLSFARRSETDEVTTDTSLNDTVIYIGGIPFYVTDAADAQKKADWLYNFLMTNPMSTQAAADAARQTIARMIQDGYVPPERRGSNTPVAPTVISSEHTVADNSGNFGSAITNTPPDKKTNWGDTDMAIGINIVTTDVAIVEEIVSAADKKASSSLVLPKIEEGALNRVVKIATDLNDLSTLASVASAGAAYKDAYDDFIASGGIAADPATGEITEEYREASDKLTDLIAAVTPIYVSPLFSVMKDVAKDVATLQAGEEPSSTQGEALGKLAYYFSSLDKGVSKQGDAGFGPEQSVTLPCYGETDPACLKRAVIATRCPLNYMVIAPDGKKAGVDPITKEVMEEIPGSFVIAPVNYNVDSQIVYLPALQSGEYAIKVTGFGNGNYTLYYKTFDTEGNVLTSQKNKGKIHGGEVLEAQFNPNADSLTRDSGKIIFVKDVIYKYVLPTIGFVFIALVVSFLVLRKKRRRL